MAYQQNLKGAENGKNAFSFSAGILMRTCGMLHSTTINSRKKSEKESHSYFCLVRAVPAEDVSYIYLSCRREETFKSLADAAAEAQCLFHPSLVLIVVARKSIHP